MIVLNKQKNRYAKYKPTGIEWIGEIPVDWGKWKIAHLFKVNRGRVIDKTQISIEQNNEQPYPVFSSQTQNNGCLGYIETYDYDKDSITWTTDGANAGSVFYRQGKFNATNVCGILTLMEKNQDYEYLTYCIRVAGLNNRRVDILGYKIMSNEMASIKIPLPSLTEQQTISAYLDEKTLLIDNIISLKHKQIDLLQERRTTLINQVVTKGLDKNVEMVDSGIERIGTIPKDWEVRKLKYETIINIDSLGEKENPNMELLYVDIGNVNILGIQNEPELLYFSEAPSRARRKVKDGDTILGTVRTYLKAIAYINNPLPNLIVSTGFAVIQPQNKMDNKYLYYQLLSEAFIQKVVANSKGVSYPAINSTELGVLKILIPSIEEQKAIADYLDSSTSQIDKTIKAVGKSIDLLTEYKQSLISNVVTGKVKVF